MSRLPHITAQRGFSLVELMVAMTLSLVLLAGALSILYSSRVTYSENDRLARLQEAGRTVVELLLRDARPSGYQGCSRPLSGTEFTNGLTDPTALLWNFGEPVHGFEAAGGTWLPAPPSAALVPDATAGSDVLVLRTTRQGLPSFRTNAPVISPVSDIQVDGPSGATVAAGTPMIISDCEGASVFMATGFTPVSATTASIGHVASGGAGVAGNASNSLTRGFTVGSLVLPVETIIYYVRDSASGNGPALWQRVGNEAPRELIEGVENLQVAYGVDLDGNLLVDEYLKADLVPDWSRVIAVSVAVLVRSPEETNLERDNRTYNLLDTSDANLGGAVLGPFDDRRQRAVFTTTIVLRNRTS
jgi:type IV pilus assembly protein PilW